MSMRRLFLDRSIGEARGVVALNDRPERLLIVRDDDVAALQLGARSRARVRKVEPSLGSAFLDLGEGREAQFSFKPDSRPIEGQVLEVEIRSEPRDGKLATVRVIGPTEGRPGLFQPAPSLEAQLRAFAAEAEIEEGRLAREMADEAESDILGVVHPLPGGGEVSIEPTRALTAIDVDVGERKGQDVKRVTRQANLAALQEAARLLRLKGLGGLIVIDLAGRGHDGTALMAAARTAFAPDNPGVSIGPVSRFGTVELTVPRRRRPVMELLLGEDGAPTDRTLAQRLIRLIESEAAAHPGARLEAQCAVDVAEAAGPLAARLADRIGARFRIAPEAGAPRSRMTVRAS